MSGMDEELRKVRAKQDKAMGEKAAEGSTEQGVLEAGIRAALDHSIDNMDPNLSDLEKALEVEIDAASFLIGMQAAAFAMQGLDTIKVAKTTLGYGLLKEFMFKANVRHKEFKRDAS